MPTPILNPYSGFQPLGLIVVSAVGTPVPLSQNIGSYYSATGKSEYALQFGQFMLRATATNTGAIYLVSPGQPASNTDAIIWFLLPGESLIINEDSDSRNSYSLDSFQIDAATNGNSVLVTGVIGA